jgi:hypothetical protein
MQYLERAIDGVIDVTVNGRKHRLSLIRRPHYDRLEIGVAGVHFFPNGRVEIAADEDTPMYRFFRRNVLAIREAYEAAMGAGGGGFE